MFGFLSPVKPLVVLCCCYVAAAIGFEILAVRQAGTAIDHLKGIIPGSAAGKGFWHWLAGEGRALSSAHLVPQLWRHQSDAPLRDIVLVLLALTSIMLLAR